MKIPEKLNESLSDQEFRHTQTMNLAYKLIDLDEPQRKEWFREIIDVRVILGR